MGNDSASGPRVWLAGPKARSIPAWGAAPGTRRYQTEGWRPVPCSGSLPVRRRRFPLLMVRAFSPRALAIDWPGAAPQAGIEARRWRCG